MALKSAESLLLAAIPNESLPVKSKPRGPNEKVSAEPAGCRSCGASPEAFCFTPSALASEFFLAETLSFGDDNGSHGEATQHDNDV